MIQETSAQEWSLQSLNMRESAAGAISVTTSAEEGVCTLQLQGNIAGLPINLSEEQEMVRDMLQLLGTLILLFAVWHLPLLRGVTPLFWHTLKCGCLLRQEWI